MAGNCSTCNAGLRPRRSADADVRQDRDGPRVSSRNARKVFENADLAIAWGRSYDVAPDGRRFLLTLNKEAPTNPAPTQMIFVQHWFEELKRLVPTK